jgi:hypothetical protein
MIFGDVERALLIKSFVWDVTLTGADETTIENYIKKIGTPKPGTVRAHNENVAWNAVAPNMNAWDLINSVDVLLGHIAAGLGVPKHWISGVVDVNLATANQMSEPAIKHLTSRQQYVRAMTVRLVTFALDSAELAGRIARRRPSPGVLPEPWPITVSMPDLRQSDGTATAVGLKAMVEVLIAARADGQVDLQTAQAAVAMQLGQIGIDVDLEAMRQRVAAEQPPARIERVA